jgi:Cu/Ag efflux protein CusF
MKKPILWLTAAWLSTAALAQTTLPTSEGEVRRVDTRAQTVTLKHGEIKNLDMPPMTMAFRVLDPGLLAQVKAGDKVRFTADRVGGNYTVLSLEPAPATEPVNAPSR